MTPYQILAEAAKQSRERSILQAWHDFACWERARNYADDPNALSKEAVQWIGQLNELAIQLNDFAGESKSDCRDALEAAAAAFARLDHERDLVEAVQTWRRRRLEEEAN